MATIDLGKIKPVWRGTWAGSTAYEKNDMIAQGVNSYICTAAHTSDASTFSNDSANWDVMATGVDIPSQTGNAGKVLKTDGSSLSWGEGGKFKAVTTYEYTGTAQSSPGAFNWESGVTWTHTLENSSNTLVINLSPQCACRYNNSALRVQTSTDGGSTWTNWQGVARAGWGSQELQANIYTGDSPFIMNFNIWETITPGVSSIKIRAQLSPDSSSWVQWNSRDGATGTSNARGGRTTLTIFEYTS